MRGFSAVLFLVISACQSTPNNTFVSFENGWLKTTPVKFNFESPPQKANLFLYIRNNNQYPFANLYIETKLSDSTGKTQTDTLSINMANPDGSWIGNGWLKTKVLKCDYLLNHHFESGRYQLEVRHLMRNPFELNPLDLLKGILGIGLDIEPIKID